MYATRQVRSTTVCLKIRDDAASSRIFLAKVKSLANRHYLLIFTYDLHGSERSGILKFAVKILPQQKRSNFYATESDTIVFFTTDVSFFWNKIVSA